MSDSARNKTVVTVISRISERPTGKEACLDGGGTFAEVAAERGVDAAGGSRGEVA